MQCQIATALRKHPVDNALLQLRLRHFGIRRDPLRANACAAVKCGRWSIYGTSAQEVAAATNDEDDGAEQGFPATLIAGDSNSPLAAISFNLITPVVVSSLTPWQALAKQPPAATTEVPADTTAVVTAAGDGRSHDCGMKAGRLGRSMVATVDRANTQLRKKQTDCISKQSLVISHESSTHS